MTIYIDVHEIDVYLALSQAAECEMIDLNGGGRPDYWWVGHGNKSWGISRKQVGEVLGGLDAVEEQLSRDYPSTDQLYLMVEGVLLPVDHAKAEVLGWSSDGRMGFRQGRRGGLHGSMARPYDFSYSGYISWLEGLEDFGIHVVQVPNRAALVTAVVALYNRSQVAPEEHKTFKRVIRSKLNIPVALPMVRSLMGVCDNTSRTFTGEQIATALEHRYGSLWALQQANPVEIAATPLESGKRTVGPAWVKRFFEAVGKVE